MTFNTLLIRPRLTDYHGISLAQEDTDFAIPFFDEDIPLYVDPILPEYPADIVVVRDSRQHENIGPRREPGEKLLGSKRILPPPDPQQAPVKRESGNPIDDGLRRGEDRCCLVELRQHVRQALKAVGSD